MKIFCDIFNYIDYVLLSSMNIRVYVHRTKIYYIACVDVTHRLYRYIA